MENNIKEILYYLYGQGANNERLSSHILEDEIVDEEYRKLKKYIKKEWVKLWEVR